MHEVGVKQLKAKLSEYLRRVDAGETLRITSRGRQVAELSPPSAQPTREPSPELLRLEAEGRVTLSRHAKPAHAPLLRRGSGRAAARLVQERDEERV